MLEDLPTVSHELVREFPCIDAKFVPVADAIRHGDALGGDHEGILALMVVQRGASVASLAHHVACCFENQEFLIARRVLQGVLRIELCKTGAGAGGGDVVFFEVEKRDLLSHFVDIENEEFVLFDGLRINIILNFGSGDYSGVIVAAEIERRACFFIS